MQTIERRVRCVLILLFAVLISVSSVVWAAKSRSPESATATIDFQMTQEELQSAVFSYAKRYVAIIGQAAVQLEEAIPTDQVRLNAARRKVYSMTAVVETAAGPYPALRCWTLS